MNTTISKVLIAEDHESANISVQQTMRDLSVAHTDYAFYCDDALSKVKLGIHNNEPYDLLITDLYFDEDARVQKISGGLALIPAVREIQPALKILVFSAENKPATIETLYNNLNIDGYVRKARNDAKELREAVEIISRNERYLPRHLTQLIRQKNAFDFTEYDITIISLLSNGIRQKDIPLHLQKNNIKPAGLSSMEKRLNVIKDALEFSNNEQLIAFCKDAGLI